MKIFRLAVSEIVFFCAIAVSSLAFSDETSTSLLFVKGLGINANFGQMMRFVGAQTQTYRNIVCILGTGGAKHLMEQEFVPVITKYQPRWDQNLAAVWSQQLSEVEMRSLLELKQQSPYASKYKAAGSQVGPAMMAASSDLLKSAVSEAVNNAWNIANTEHLKNPTTTCKL